MTMQKIVGRVRGLQVPNIGENQEEEEFWLTPTGDGLCAQGLPELTEIVRLGDSWVTMSAAQTGLTGVPTTVAGYRLFNGEPHSGKSYVIDSVNVVKVIIDVTTDDLFAVFGQVMKPPINPITDDGATSTLRSLIGRNSYDGRARKDSNQAGSAATGAWDMLGTSAPQAPAIAGSAWQSLEIPLRGRYIVPPYGGFGVHVAEVTATASTFRFTIRWHEVRSPTVS